MKKMLMALAAGCLLTGCAWNQESALDQNWGRSYQAAKYNQILNPDAAKNLSPVEGLDGVAAQKAEEGYQNSFKDAFKNETQQGTPNAALVKF